MSLLFRANLDLVNLLFRDFPAGELSTYLSGRYEEFIIYPFSFAEFLELYRSIAPDEPVQRCFQKYLLSGGMPYLANICSGEVPQE